MAYLVLVLVSLLFLKVVFVETRVPVEQLIKECSDLRQTIVCDPDGILNNATDKIKEQIQKMSTTSSCRPKHGKCRGKNVNCDMYIVINEGMQTNFKYNHLLEEAKRFATQLLESLVSSECGNSFLLYYSYQDQVFYVVTENGVRNKLRSERIGEIALLNKKKLSSSLTDGLISLIKDFWMVFEDKYISELHFDSPKFQAAQLHAGSPTTTISSPLLAVIVGMLCRKLWNSHFLATS